MVRNLLDELAIKYLTDKCSLRHGYTERYNCYFLPIRANRMKVVEIGVGAGASMKMWEEYFPNSQIYGIDTEHSCKDFEDSRVKVFIGDQADMGFLKRFAEQTGGNFDIIIDDGGHKVHQQLTSFMVLFKHVKQGGAYVVEDLHTSYYRRLWRWL